MARRGARGQSVDALLMIYVDAREGCQRSAERDFATGAVGAGDYGVLEAGASLTPCFSNSLSAGGWKRLGIVMA